MLLNPKEPLDPVDVDWLTSPDKDTLAPEIGSEDPDSVTVPAILPVMAIGSSLEQANTMAKNNNILPKRLIIFN